MAWVRWVVWLGVLSMFLPLAAAVGRCPRARRPAPAARGGTSPVGLSDQWYRLALLESARPVRPGPGPEDAGFTTAHREGPPRERKGAARNLVIEVRPFSAQCYR